MYQSQVCLRSIYALLDAIDSEGEADTKNLMNDSDTKFIDKSAIENGDVDSNLLPIKNSIEAESHVIPSLVPIDAVVRFSKPHFDSKEDNDVPLSRLKASKGDEEWKWRKKLEQVLIKKCKFRKEGIVNMETEMGKYLDGH